MGSVIVSRIAISGSVGQLGAIMDAQQAHFEKSKIVLSIVEAAHASELRMANLTVVGNAAGLAACAAILRETNPLLPRPDVFSAGGVFFWGILFAALTIFLGATRWSRLRQQIGEVATKGGAAEMADAVKSLRAGRYFPLPHLTQAVAAIMFFSGAGLLAAAFYKVAG